MSSVFHERLNPSDAYDLQLMSRITFETREHRQNVLAAMNVEDEETLLARIISGEVDEHPAYEHYLAARILGDTHEAARNGMIERLREINR